MKYKLFNEVTQSPPIRQILYNRGIDTKEKQDKWNNASFPEDVNSPFAFGEKKIKHAVDLIQKALNNSQEVYVIVDCDADGWTAAAIAINYLTDLTNVEYAKKHFHYIMHSGKQHGLADCVEQFPDNCFAWLPDSCTNDNAQLQELLKRGCSVLITDHHEADDYLEDEDNLVIVNNQISEYSNKDLSGAGITWQICKAYDILYKQEEGWLGADKYLDLVALGAISDMMLYTSIETKAFVDIGLANIRNPFFYYMCEKNKFSIDKMGGINYMSIAFYVTPFINAMVRSGTPEEKDMAFQSFLQIYAFDKIESNKRGHKGELVPRVEEAVRIAANVKARQTKLQDAAMELLEERIKEQNLLDNGIIILLCEPGEVEKGLVGLVANKIQAKYQHPCIVLIKSKEKDDKEYYYRGSIRNYSMSENQDLRQLCLDTGLPEWVQGHQNAAGLSIAESKVTEFQKVTNEIYKDISKEPVYWVDYEWFSKDINSSDILAIADSKAFWGQGIPEPYVAIRNIPLESVQLLSPDKHPTLKIHLSNGVDIMKFKSSQEEYEQFIKPNMYLTAICRCAKNEWMNRITAQLIVEDFYIEEQWIF